MLADLRQLHVFSKHVVVMIEPLGHIVFVCIKLVVLPTVKTTDHILIGKKQTHFILPDKVKNIFKLLLPAKQFEVHKQDAGINIRRSPFPF